MKTGTLYYADCHRREFTARVLSCEETETGWAVTLDQTAFYPEGGGQACDLGTLGAARVQEVREYGEDIVHLCDGPLAVNDTVTGRIDWQRRFDLMQQHTGEHIVSGIVYAMFGFHNVGFHVGADVLQVDFDGIIPVDALADIEAKANRAVFENIPVRCWVPSEEALPTVFYRTKRALPWPVRIVEVPGYDSCACCGVHVAATGEIGMIKLLSTVKFHGGTRLEMVCGGRALALFDRVYEQNRLVSQAFSAKLLETGAAAQKMNEALAAEKFRATGLERQLFDAIAQNFKDKGNTVYFAQALEPGAVRELADRISRVCGGVAAVLSGSDEAGYSVCLAGTDVKALGQAMNARLNGRGGGKPGFHQGSVKATAAQIRAFFEQVL